MARYGFSPATRVFEAAGAGACIITDQWKGIDFFSNRAGRCLLPLMAKVFWNICFQSMAQERALSVLPRGAGFFLLTPMRTVRLWWRVFSMEEYLPGRLDEHCHSWAFRNFVLGQWARDHLPQSASWAFESRTRHSFSRAGLAVVRLKSG